MHAASPDHLPAPNPGPPDLGPPDLAPPDLAPPDPTSPDSPLPDRPVLELRREVRFCINDDDAIPNTDDATGTTAVAADTPQPPRHNTFSAWPPMYGLGRYYALDVACRGHADPRTGYFINIKQIDRAVRDHALPHLADAAHGRGVPKPIPMGGLLRDCLALLQPALGDSVHRIELRLTPFHSLAMTADDPDRVLVRQQYEFSAAHRLHVPEFDDERNRAIFGKCNNPAGHGHNYRVEVVVAVPVDPRGGVPSVEQLDAVVDQYVIEPLDHKHLNADVPAFADRNPSVEHISVEVWGMLAQPMAHALPGATLAEVSVWETDKTMCSYRGPGGV